MLHIVLLAAGIYGAFVGTLYVFQRQLMYLPATEAADPAASGLGDMRPVTLTTADGLALTSWYRPAAAGRPTLVFFQGNAGHIGHRGLKVRPFLDAGFGLLLLGYRGYGGNPGRPSEEGLYADGRAALAFLEGLGVPARSWALYGESLGSGVAVHLAHEQAASEAVGAVVLEAPFTSMGAAAQHHYPFVPAQWLVKDRYESLAKIDAIKAPLLIVHGERDSIVPAAFGRQLFAAAQEPKESQWVARGDHNDLHDHGVIPKVIDFLDRRLVKGGGK
jgi:hypothetical protein